MLILFTTYISIISTHFNFVNPLTKKRYIFERLTIYIYKAERQKNERTIFTMKGILSVLAITLVMSILVPLVMASAYYKDETQTEIPVLQDTNTPDKEQSSVITPTFEEKEDKKDFGLSDKTDDEIIFGYDEEDSFALSPLFQVLDKSEVTNENTDKEASEDTEAETEEPEEDTTEKEEDEKEPAKEENKKEEIEREPSYPEKDPDFSVSVSDSAAKADDVKNIKVYLHSSKKYVTMSMTEYLYGVVAAEMPSYFEPEALKVQAIASRTYTLYKMLNIKFNSSGHGSGGAHICTNSGHCQAYLSRQDAEKKWGKAYADQIFNAVCPAVDATKGQVLLYDGTPIFSAYHSLSYKFTDDVKNVWGGDYPYLKSVSSPEDDSFNGMTANSSFTSAKFKKYITSQSKKASFSSDPSEWVGKVTLNESGRVDKVVIGGVEFTGREIQSVFGLRAANFSISYDAKSDKFTFSVKGRGHGIGMSQYGANLLAQEGYTYSEILCHYYTGVTIGSYDFKR